jgi:GAF domain-containing protein
MSAEPDALLQSIVALVRTVYGARACSIMRHDAEADELVFEAVSGEGEDTLVGRRIPRTGVAGWVLAAEEPIAIADVISDPRFDRSIAESTGYVPTALTVFPLLHDERALGVLNVLDQGAASTIGLADMDALGRFAQHAAQALALVEEARGGPPGERARRQEALGLIERLQSLLR